MVYRFINYFFCFAVCLLRTLLFTAGRAWSRHCLSKRQYTGISSGYIILLIISVSYRTRRCNDMLLGSSGACSTGYRRLSSVVCTWLVPCIAIKSRATWITEVAVCMAAADGTLNSSKSWMALRVISKSRDARGVGGSRAFTAHCSQLQAMCGELQAI